MREDSIQEVVFCKWMTSYGMNVQLQDSFCSFFDLMANIIGKDPRFLRILWNHFLDKYWISFTLYPHPISLTVGDGSPEGATWITKRWRHRTCKIHLIWTVETVTRWEDRNYAKKIRLEDHQMKTDLQLEFRCLRSHSILWLYSRYSRMNLGNANDKSMISKVQLL